MLNFIRIVIAIFLILKGIAGEQVDLGINSPQSVYDISIEYSGYISPLNKTLNLNLASKEELLGVFRDEYIVEQIIAKRSITPFRSVEELYSRVSSHIDFELIINRVSVDNPYTKDELLASLIKVKLKKEYDEMEIAFIEKELEGIYSRLQNIDYKVLDILVGRGVKFYAIDFPITDLPEYEYLRGVVPRGYEGTGMTWDDIVGIGGTKAVAIIIGKSYDNSFHSSINLELHELGHSVDYVGYDFISERWDFIPIWQEEASKMFPDSSYMQGYCEEFFAESFAYYYHDELSRAKLKAYAPKTYEYLREVGKGNLRSGR